jgi:hypothetical protein
MEIAHKQANVFSQKILPYHYSMMEVRVILQSKIKIYRISDLFDDVYYRLNRRQLIGFDNMRNILRQKWGHSWNPISS